jgi:hypothetical protein
MSLLRTHRSNLKANDVMREIRQAAAAAEDRPIARRLADLKPKLDAGKTPFLDAVESALGGDFRWTVDPRAFDAVVTCEVTPPKEGSGLDVLEELCAQAKVDFAYLYGIILIAAPERLWPPPPPRSRPLNAGEKARAKSLLAKLGSESPDERDKAAAELRRFGPPVLPLLEAGASDPDAEVAARCRSLTDALCPCPARVFGPPAAARQKLTGADAALYGELKGKAMTYKVRDLNLINSLKLLLGQIEGDFLKGDYSNAKLTFAFDNLPATAILAIMTQAYGLDYAIENGHVLVGPREQIERLIAPRK